MPPVKQTKPGSNGLPSNVQLPQQIPNEGSALGSLGPYQNPSAPQPFPVGLPIKLSAPSTGINI
jgi:hypothetical protein